MAAIAKEKGDFVQDDGSFFVLRSGRFAITTSSDETHKTILEVPEIDWREITGAGHFSANEFPNATAEICFRLDGSGNYPNTPKAKRQTVLRIFNELPNPSNTQYKVEFT